MNTIAIVGRPNVGKSTLFNRFIEQRKAIMDNVSGVTRDRHYGFGEWRDKHFTVIDTGGYVSGSEDVFEKAIRLQVELALDEATVILFMVDCIDGLTNLDKDFARVLRTSKKPLIIVANKADTKEKSLVSHEFYELGLDASIMSVSSISGSGTGELLDQVVAHFQQPGEEDPEKGIPRISILGRPNVGKSSLLNVLLGTERSIVTDIAGTTRDAINSRYNAFGKDFIITDTAGIRKKAKVKEDIEFYSVLRAIRAMQDSDVCIVMIDAERGFESQDQAILALVDRYKKGAVIMVNKWDLIKKDTHTAKHFKSGIQEKIATLDYMPIVFTSVTDKQRIYKILELVLQVYKNREQRIATSKLNQLMLGEINHYPPPADKGKYIKIKYITQLPIKTPTFAFFCNHPKNIKEPYKRFLINKLRKHFDFSGVPVTVIFRKK